MKKKGFTLVELLAVIAILAILVIIALPNIMSLFNEAKKNSFTNEIKEIYKTAQQQWMMDSMTETYDALWQEYLGIYGQGMNESGIIIESEAADLLVGIMRGFHLGVYDIGCYGKTASGQSYMDYNPLCDTLNFIKENKVIEKLKKYCNS